MSNRPLNPLPRQTARLWWPLLTLLLTLGGQRAHAQDAPSNVTSAQATDLASALSRASARDPQAAQLSARLNQAQAALDIAHNLTPGPAAVSLNHLSDRLQRDQGRREWEVELATPLWLPGQQGASQRQAERALAELQARLALRQLELAGELRNSWWQLASARAARELAQQRLQTATALEQTVQRRYQSGDVARVDANLARTERLSAQAEALEADTTLLQAQQAYSGLTGLPPPTALPPEAAPTLPSAGQTAPETRADHPQWLALQSAVALANSRLALVDSSRRDAPELALRWTTQRSDAFSPSDQAIGVKLTVPLSSGDRVRQESAGARADLAQAERELAMLGTQLDQALQRARSELATAQTQLELATTRCELTTDNLKLAQRAFDLGEQDLPTLLRARSADHEAQAWLTRQRIAYQAAVSHLQQARGLLPQPATAEPAQAQPTPSQPNTPQP
ncbi:TolC family protein [Aquabacterium sp. NJ1]|uniref:TolC family protein n=1 Tax=Aquabacterium sp. NJ1 TaxID=1538295 RepID=UPI0013788044|nr:TolC family protein [Aquabacterium sp. NJ1]